MLMMSSGFDTLLRTPDFYYPEFDEQSSRE